MEDIDCLLDEALDEAELIFCGWIASRPQPQWPAGTTIVRQKNAAFDSDYDAMSFGYSRYHLVTLPSGGQVVTLTQSRDQGRPYADGLAPQMIYDWMFDSDGSLYVFVRVAQMTSRSSPAAPTHLGTDWLVRELGLELRHRVGTLSKRPRERTHTVSDGWGY